MDFGRWLDQDDENRKGRVAVLGASVADKLFGEVPPEGEDITINGLRFSVIGVLQTKSADRQLQQAGQRMRVHSVFHRLVVPRPEIP